MKQFCTISTIYACISVFLLTSPAIADSKLIDSMNITGGAVVWSTPGGMPEEIVFTSFGLNTNLVGGYIGVGGSTSEPFTPPDPDNIIIFQLIGGLNDVVTYTAASNLGTAYDPAGLVPGGPVPTGTLDGDLNIIQMDLSSWFGNLNNATDIWAGTGLDDGFTSPLATGTWDPVTFEYELSWNSRIPDSPGNPFPGLMSSWTLTGHAYPVTTFFITIDIKPGNKRNIMNPYSKGGIWVAILSDTDPESPFDPSSQVDISTVEFGPNSANVIRYKVNDVNKDGLGDLLLRFKIHQTGIACADTEVTLTGETFNGQSFTGTDSIKIVGCKKNQDF